MKLGYSIIIVILLIAAVFLLVKYTKKPMAQDNSQTENQSAQASTAKDNSNTEVAKSGEVSDQLLMTTTKEGSGDAVKAGDTVSVNYTGYLADGTKFDASADHGAPFKFTVGAGQVIKGWDLGVVGMKKGEVRRLVIPANYAYGEAGYPGVIPPNATLAFEVELLEINPTK